MALLTSPRFQIQYPDSSRIDRPDIPLHLTNIVSQLDAKGAMYGQGLFANRPVSTPGTQGIAGRLYMSTDGQFGAQVGTYILFYDYGTGWALVTGIYAGPPADSITAIEIAPNAVTSVELADNSVDTAAIQDAAITAAKFAAALKPSQGAAGTTEALRAIGMGAGQVLSSSNLPNIFQSGPRASLPTNSAGNDSLWYYATDIDVIYFGAGGTWHRVGAQAGDIIWTIENTARFGYLICTGQAWPGTTGIYADLFGKWGGQYPTVLPDFQGREFVAKGTHADVNTNGFNEGVAVTSRRPRHKSSKNGSASVTGANSSLGLTGANSSLGLVDPTHLHGGSLSWTGNGASAPAGLTAHETQAANTSYAGTGMYFSGGNSSIGLGGGNSSIGVSDTITIGPQTGAEPIDSSAYIVLQPQVKL